MALKLLVVLGLLTALVQVRAQIGCYPNEQCGGTVTDVMSAEECCVGESAKGKSFTSSSTAPCQPCIVIGFTPVIVTIPEESGDYHTTQIRLLTDPDSLDDDYKDAKIELTVEVFTEMSNATFGTDFTIQHWSQSSTTTTSFVLRNLTFDINIMANNDENLVEREEFRLIVTAQFMNGSLGDIAVANSARVIIEDDDVIVIGFTRSETEVDESDGEVELPLRVTRGLNLPTYFCVHALTYTNYSNHYEEWRTKYPNLPADSLTDEKDEAESEDFTTKKNCFTVEPRFQGKIDYVKINLTNDDKVEPVHEGFRVLLAVDESRMPISYASFEGLEQLAVVRIDDYDDEITFGFLEETIFVRVERTTTIDMDLRFDIISGSTEFPINLAISIDDEKSTATPEHDYTPKTINLKQTVQPPNTINVKSILSFAVITHLDTTFDDDKTIVFQMSNEDLKEHVDPFMEGNTITVPTNRVKLNPGNLTIVIQDTVLVDLDVPDEVDEGDSFTPMVTVSQLVDASFIVFVESGTAEVGSDVNRSNQSVTFSSSQNQMSTAEEISINTDRFVELPETFSVTIELVEPLNITDRFTFSNKVAVVKINDINHATVAVTPNVLEVQEDTRDANVTVGLGGDELGPNVAVDVNVYTTPGTATPNSDFTALNRTVTLSANNKSMDLNIPIIDDDVPEESPETILVNLKVLTPDINVTADPTSVSITIMDDDVIPVLEKMCTLSSSLNLTTFHNEHEQDSGESIDISKGCERTLVTSCSSDLGLEIRVDFFENDFTTTRVYILYDGQEVFINDDMSISPPTSPSNIIVYGGDMGVGSVLLSDIPLTVTLNATELTISTDNTSLFTGGLCGNFGGDFYYPDCQRTANLTRSLDKFLHAYKIKPSDLVIRDEREECGVTANDTIISDPLMTVPIHVPGYADDLNLCYEIHGAAGKYFNLVSDGCTSINAHYKEATSGSTLNIIDAISIVAVDHNKTCNNISIDVVDFYPIINGEGKDESVRKKRSPVQSVYNNEGIIVELRGSSHLRVLVPNCADNELEMWIFHQSEQLYDQYTNTTVGPIDMIKFEITRGLNLRETSHGLLGQFWNIPIKLTSYNGPLVYEPYPGDEYYTVEVNHPADKRRSFVAVMHDVTWEWRDQKCLYAGDRQGGPAGEVRNDGSVIQGSFEDYKAADKFETDYSFGVFEYTCP